MPFYSLTTLYSMVIRELENTGTICTTNTIVDAKRGWWHRKRDYTRIRQHLLLLLLLLTEMVTLLLRRKCSRHRPVVASCSSKCPRRDWLAAMTSPMTSLVALTCRRLIGWCNQRYTAGSCSRTAYCTVTRRPWSSCVRHRTRLAEFRLQPSG